MNGIYWMLVSVVTSAVMSLCIKSLGAVMSASMIVALRFGLTLVILVAGCLLFQQMRAGLRFSKPWLHILRGTLIGVASIMGFYALTTEGLALVTTLFFTTSIFAVLINIVLYGERIGARRIGAIFAGFIGVMIVLRPGYAELSLGIIAALVSSLCFAIALSMSRKVSDADGPLAVLFSASVLTFLVALPQSAASFRLPDTPLLWGLVAILVATGLIRQFADIRAYTLADAGVLAPISYLRLVVVGIGGYVFFSEVPDLATVIGAAIIISASLFITYRERALGRKGRPAAGP